MYEVSVNDSFSSAHFLPDYDGKCEQLHGHNYKVVMIVRGETLDSKGLLVDFAVMKNALRTVTNQLDHRLLNDLVWFKDSSPSAENIARVIFTQTAALMPGAKIFAIEVWETEKNQAVYYGEPHS